MSAMTDIWTQDDYAEYERQLALIKAAYGNSIPKEAMERHAADIVNKQKQITI